jgi:hypothetical protein
MGAKLCNRRGRCCCDVIAREIESHRSICSQEVPRVGASASRSMTSTLEVA